jgi:hypothetical protein
LLTHPADACTNAICPSSRVPRKTKIKQQKIQCLPRMTFQNMFVPLPPR